MSDPRLVTKPDRLREVCKTLSSEPALAFDTEFVPEYTYSPQLCLIQIASRDDCFAVDTIACTELDPLWELLADPNREIVVHAGKEELSFCRANLGSTPGHFFDVQIGAGLVGLGYPLSLDNLLQKLTRSHRVKKTETRTDWRKRPLSSRQIDYALDDVRYLLEVRDNLKRRLDELNRQTWMDEETARFVSNISRQSEDRWHRVPGSGNLRGLELSVFKELVNWRDERARHLDRPTRWVLRDDLLVELAKRQPKSIEDLRSLRGLGNVAQGSSGDDLIEAIRHGLSRPQSEWPQRPPRREAGDEQMVVKILSAALLQVAHSHSVSAGLLGSNEDLRDLLHFMLAGSKNAEPPRLASGWRKSVCWDYLTDVLEGRVHLRICRDGDRLNLEFESRS